MNATAHLWFMASSFGIFWCLYNRLNRNTFKTYSGLFNKNLVTEYPYERSVTAPNQIRTVIQAFKDNLFTNLFPDRSGEWVPKTLVFAKDDNHAEEIIHIVREMFNQGNGFAKKITYRTCEKPKDLIKGFRVDPFPRIAVTVDMIATATDIEPIEVVIFMRDVKSQGYFEQMKGRGVRSIKNSDLQQVTPDAKTKTRFIWRYWRNWRQKEHLKTPRAQTQYFFW